MQTLSESQQHFAEIENPMLKLTHTHKEPVGFLVTLATREVEIVVPDQAKKFLRPPSEPVVGHRYPATWEA